MKEQNQRQLRVGEEIRHALAWVFERGDIRDPDLAGVRLTITEVRISPDLRSATVFFVPLLGEGNIPTIIQGLKRVKGYLRHQLASQVRMRVVPDLRFAADQSFDEAAHINNILHSPEVARDIGEGESTPTNEESPICPPPKGRGTLPISPSPSKGEGRDGGDCQDRTEQP